MVFLSNISILLDIPILRDIIVFIFLSFIPGFAILRLLKLKTTSSLDTLLFSVALSIAFVMFIGLLVNAMYLFLGFSQPLSTIPLTISISASTLTVFIIDYRRTLSETRSSTNFTIQKEVFPLCILLFILPIFSAISILYLNVPIILISFLIIAALCVMSGVSRRLCPEKLFPLLIFLISIALICQVVLSSRYILGWDANLEFGVFRLTQVNMFWGPLNVNTQPLVTLSYNSMLSVTLLPTVYSALMNAQGEIVFKILYPFIFSFVPLTLYRTYEKQFGKLIGLFSVFFFIFTSIAFFGIEPLSINKQIVGQLFFALCVFLLMCKDIPVAKRRLLLIIFGVTLVVSHYSLAYIFLAIVAIFFIISKVKHTFDETINTITALFLLVVAFSWYAIGHTSPLTMFFGSIKWALMELTAASLPTQAVTASSVFALPEIFTAATWINLSISSIVHLFLIVGFLSIILGLKGKEISGQFKILLCIASIILFISLIAPSIASIFNFTRFYAIALMFLAPCFVFGSKTVLEAIGKAWMKLKRPLKRPSALKNKNIDVVLLLIAIILCVYFLSQTGFINRITGGAIHSYPLDFDKMITSNDPRIKIALYSTNIPEQDVSSATWLYSHKGLLSNIYTDYVSGSQVLTSYGLIPRELMRPIANSTNLLSNSFVYLSRLNIVDNIITTAEAPFNSSDLILNLNQSNLIYSNGNGEIWHVVFQIDPFT